MNGQTSLVLAGINHKTAPVALREQLSFSNGSLRPVLHELVGDLGFSEVVLLSTCNRTEIYGVVCQTPEMAWRALCHWLTVQGALPPDLLDRHLYYKQGQDVVAHLLRVASGLDSLVLGETQILGQVRGAFEVALEAGTVAKRLSKLFRSALETGKAVRSSTALGEMPVSVASVTLQLVDRVFGELTGRTVLIVGAGEICTAAAQHLAERRPDRLMVVNRTRKRAEDLAARCKGLAASMRQLCDELVRADVVVTSTGSEEPVITTKLLRAVMTQRRGRRLLIIDLAVPRDVEPGADAINNVYLYDIDDLQQLAAENLRQRQAEIPAAEKIIDAALEKYTGWEASLAVVPTIVALRSRLESIRKDGVRQYENKLPDLDEQGRRCIEQMTQTIVNRILHEPQMRLRRCSGPATGATMVESLRYLFNLDGAGDER